MFASMRDELHGDRFWRYQRQVSAGLQEYIEALSFAHYLETGRLVSFDEVQRELSDERGPVCLALMSAAVASWLKTRPLAFLCYSTVLPAAAGGLSAWAV